MSFEKGKYDIWWTNLVNTTITKNRKKYA